ncbi:hypothetical protein [Eudoraea sp.]|uniref:hypothetical protein n=1 Tax=Eudoraea sp. TaxID=1979955 RepID=UPI003C753E4E
MKSNFLKSIVYIVALGMITFSCSTDTDKLPVDFDSLKVSGGPFATLVSSEGSSDFNKNDPAGSTFSNTYQLITPAPNLGSDIRLIELFVSFSGENVDAPEALYASVDAADFDLSSGGYPEVTFDFAGDEVLSLLGVSQAQLEGGDQFTYRLALTNPQGTFSKVSANFQNQSAPYPFLSTVVCIPITIPEGDWLVNMVDTFGDGWQTDDASGGSGITVTLDTGEVLEVGMCSDYQASEFDCVDGPSAAVGTVTMPAGIVTAEWFFPGDFYGEISFNVVAPSGNIVYDSPQASPAGILAINYCNE